MPKKQPIGIGDILRCTRDGVREYQSDLSPKVKKGELYKVIDNHSHTDHKDIRWMIVVPAYNDCGDYIYAESFRFERTSEAMKLEVQHINNTVYNRYR